MRRSTISRRPVVIGAVSVLCGLAALVVAGAAVRSAATSARASLVPVTVAVRALPEGTVLADGDVRVVRVPPDARPAGVVASPQGRTLTMPILSGDPILDGKLSPSGRGISALLGPGQVAAPVVPSAPVSIAPGERVRITATFDPQRYAGRDLVRVVAAAAVVLSADPKDGRLVVGLSPSERDNLALAQATARLDVAVLAPGAR